MFTTRITSVGAVLLAFVAGAAASLLALHPPAAVFAQDQKPAAKVEGRVRPLLEARLEAAREELDARKKEFEQGRGTLDLLLGAARRVLDSQRELSDKKAGRVAAVQAYFDVTREVEETVKGWHDAGRVAVQDWKEAQYYRLDAEIMLERAKGD
jgi:hypothetical protein